MIKKELNAVALCPQPTRRKWKYIGGKGRGVHNFVALVRMRLTAGAEQTETEATT